MCGRGKDLLGAILYVWQPKELRAHFRDVRQRKDLGLNLPSEGFGIVANCDPAEGLGIGGAVRIATITAQFTKYNRRNNCTEG